MANCVCGCGLELPPRKRSYANADCQKKANRVAWIKRAYGLTLEEWNIIWTSQGEVCAICKRKPKTKKDGTQETFHLDHEHQNGPAGPVRGIVCPYCNTRIIGRLKSHAIAQALADYLRDPPATKALGREVIAPGRPRKRRTYKRKRK